MKIPEESGSDFVFIYPGSVMKKRKGYSLAELLTVILIVSVLAAAALSLMRGRADSAKWSEGKARAGMIATAIRSWIAGHGQPGSWTNIPGSLDAGELGFGLNDLKGRYFAKENFTWEVNYDGQNLSYVITVSKPVASWKPDQIVLDTGVWLEPGL
ncbi:MAG: type IV pilin protein [Planctomycetota bacterium]|jgi:prepilin-type N-terminal cleavage/methylation domain-containing protein